MKEIACASGVELVMDYLEGVLPARNSRGARRPRGRMCAVHRLHRVVPRNAADRGEATATALPAGLEASLLTFLRADRDT